MGRFLQADDRPSYSDLKPERFAAGEDYVSPEDARERNITRTIDDAPTPDELRHAARAPFAGVGYATRKRKA